MNIPKIRIPKMTLSFLHEEGFAKYIRILKLAHPPTTNELKKISLVAAVGILVIGFVGFLIASIFYYVG